ncbi:ferredoxin [Kitasatospora sp. MMS16-BH015]|uniref:PDR/VanB family oxidoreductase n=1 Tax=Kitasatospora sp. MMS16-BH015 TaxID=2018025 RepID=UPI000CA38551|nr:PDR/VanB family oxidoreductase [Kitasatospora sp. MMS16-BH015]AUG81001.1 ferredoxin [Kitasatospora sp. MMS16-BH015]
MDLQSPPPDLYGRPRADRFIQRLTAFSDWYNPLVARRAVPRPTAVQGATAVQLVVVRHEVVADGVVELRLASPYGEVLPAWQPGGRVQLILPSGRKRHYSLCGDPADRHGYRIAVRRIEGGGGGSVEVHDELFVGARLAARPPRNGFAFCGEGAVLLLAGGIGITPLLPMAYEARRRGLDWQLVHTGRDAASMPFAAELKALDPRRVVLLNDAEHGVPEAAELIAAGPKGAAVYCCGPAPMLAAVRAATPGDRPLHFERFGAAPITDGHPFTVQLGEEGPMAEVPADRSALDVLRELRPDLPYSCHQGFCGTCEVRVKAGTPEHRDRRLTAEDRAAGLLLPCVSRAAEGETLVLDL